MVSCPKSWNGRVSAARKMFCHLQVGLLCSEILGHVNINEEVRTSVSQMIRKQSRSVFAAHVHQGVPSSSSGPSSPTVTVRKLNCRSTGRVRDRPDLTNKGTYFHEEGKVRKAELQHRRCSWTKIPISKLIALQSCISLI